MQYRYMAVPICCFFVCFFCCFLFSLFFFLGGWGVSGGGGELFV